MIDFSWTVTKIVSAGEVGGRYRRSSLRSLTGNDSGQGVLLWPLIRPAIRRRSYLEQNSRQRDRKKAGELSRISLTLKSRFCFRGLRKRPKIIVVWLGGTGENSEDRYGIFSAACLNLAAPFRR